MMALIALGCSSLLLTIMVVCAFAGRPVQDSLNEMQDDQKAD